MAGQNMQSLAAAVEETIGLVHQVIEQTCAKIARSQALSQAEADLAQFIERMIDDPNGCAHEPQGRTD
jgi:thiamine phosphate synthase YjbQ (UPF0047 family)